MKQIVFNSEQENLNDTGCPAFVNSKSASITNNHEVNIAKNIINLLSPLQWPQCITDWSQPPSFALSEAMNATLLSLTETTIRPDFRCAQIYL